MSKKMTRRCDVCGWEGQVNPKCWEGEDFWQCRGCGSFFLDKKITFQEIQSSYDEDYFRKDYKKGDEFDYFSQKEEKISSFVDKLSTVKTYVSKEGAKILDVGCAAGYFLELAKRNGYLAEGVEVSKEATDFAIKEFGLKILTDDLKKVESGEVYDAVTFFQVLEHLEDPASYLKKTFELLKPGAYVFVEVPNPISIDAFLSRDNWKRVLSVPYHLSLLSPKGLAIALEKAGFVVIEERIYFSSIVGKWVKRVFNVFRKRGIKGQKKDITTNLLPEKKRPVWKRTASRIFPGSNMLFVAQKPLVR